VERIEAHIRQVNPHTAVFRLSATSGEGFDAWHDWLAAQLGAIQSTPALIHAQ
jgi:hydrogenase nickel incorporation protein HypB